MQGVEAEVVSQRLFRERRTPSSTPMSVKLLLFGVPKVPYIPISPQRGITSHTVAICSTLALCLSQDRPPTRSASKRYGLHQHGGEKIRFLIWAFQPSRFLEVFDSIHILICAFIACYICIHTRVWAAEAAPVIPARQGFSMPSPNAPRTTAPILSMPILQSSPSLGPA